MSALALLVTVFAMIPIIYANHNARLPNGSTIWVLDDSIPDGYYGTLQKQGDKFVANLSTPVAEYLIGNEGFTFELEYDVSGRPTRVERQIRLVLGGHETRLCWEGHSSVSIIFCDTKVDLLNKAEKQGKLQLVVRQDRTLCNGIETLQRINPGQQLRLDKKTKAVYIELSAQGLGCSARFGPGQVATALVQKDPSTDEAGLSGMAIAAIALGTFVGVGAVIGVIVGAVLFRDKIKALCRKCCCCCEQEEPPASS